MSYHTHLVNTYLPDLWEYYRLYNIIFSCWKKFYPRVGFVWSKKIQIAHARLSRLFCLIGVRPIAFICIVNVSEWFPLVKYATARHLMLQTGLSLSFALSPWLSSGDGSDLEPVLSHSCLAQAQALHCNVNVHAMNTGTYYTTCINWFVIRLNITSSDHDSLTVRIWNGNGTFTKWGYAGVDEKRTCN